MYRHHHERTPVVQRWEVIHRARDPRRHHVAVNRDSHPLAHLELRSCHRRQRQLARRYYDAPGRATQRLFPPDPQARVAAAGRLRCPFRAVGHVPALGQRRPGTYFLESFYHHLAFGQARPVRRDVVERQPARRRPRKGVAGYVYRHHPPPFLIRHGLMFRRQRSGNVLPRFPSPRRRKRTQLQVAIYSPLVADACPQPIAGQLNTCGHVLYIVPSHPDANPLGARRQRDSRRFRRQRAPQRGQQRVQRSRFPLRKIVPPPGCGRHRDRVNPHYDPALRSSVQKSHRLPDHRRHRVHAVDGQQPVHSLGFRPSQEPGAAQDHVAPDPVARLIGLAAGQRGLERPGEYPQRRRQRHHHRQRCVGQRVPGHPPQRQRHPRRRRALASPRGGLHHPGQRAQHQERQRQQRRRRRHQQRRVQRRPAPGQ